MYSRKYNSAPSLGEGTTKKSGIAAALWKKYQNKTYLRTDLPATCTRVMARSRAAS